MKKQLTFTLLISAFAIQAASASNMFCVSNPPSPPYASVSPAQRSCDAKCKPNGGMLVYSTDSRPFVSISDDFIGLCLSRNKIACQCRG